MTTEISVMYGSEKVNIASGMVPNVVRQKYVAALN